MDPNTANNSATDSDTITYKADLKVTITDGKTAAVPGSKDTYTIVVRNVGPSDVTGAVVSDTFPDQFHWRDLYSDADWWGFGIQRERQWQYK